jgi:transcriptional regulator with XRE-family HTH domain
MKTEGSSRFAEILRELRVTKKLTQQDVSEVLETDRSCIANYERGKRMPPLESLIKIARFFDVSIDYLVLGQNFKLPKKQEVDEEMARELMAENTALMEESLRLHERLKDKESEVALLKDLVERLNNYVHFLEEKINRKQ